MILNFYPIKFALAFISLTIINSFLISVDVPRGIVTAFSIAYIYLFPWKFLVIEETPNE